MPKTQYPDTKIVDGQTAVRVDSPLPHWPGCIYVPRELSPDQFDTWWIAKNTPSPEGCPPERKQYMDRQHLIMEWHIEGVDVHHVTPDGRKLPSANLLGFITAATIPIIDAAMILPNLPGWWNKGATGDD